MLIPETIIIKLAVAILFIGAIFIYDSIVTENQDD